MDKSARRTWRDRVETYALTPEGKIYGGRYTDDKMFGVFGGGVDPGEDILEAAKREFREESGREFLDPEILPVPPAMNRWRMSADMSDKQRERIQKHIGSRARFVVGKLGPVTSEDRGPDTDSGMFDIREYDIPEALQHMHVPTDERSEEINKVRRKRIKVLKLLLSRIQDKTAADVPETPATEPTGKWKYNVRSPNPITKDYIQAYSLPAGPGKSEAYRTRADAAPETFKPVRPGVPTVSVAGHAGGKTEWRLDKKYWRNLLPYIHKVTGGKPGWDLDVDACNLRGTCQEDLEKALGAGAVAAPGFVVRPPAFTYGLSSLPSPAFDFSTGLPATRKDYDKAGALYAATTLHMPPGTDDSINYVGMADTVVGPRRSLPALREFGNIARQWEDPEFAIDKSPRDPIVTSVYPNRSLPQEWGRMVQKYKDYIRTRPLADVSVADAYSKDWKKFKADYGNLARSASYKLFDNDPGRAELLRKSLRTSKYMNDFADPLFTDEQLQQVVPALRQYDRLRQSLGPEEALEKIREVDPEGAALIETALDAGMTMAKTRGGTALDKTAAVIDELKKAKWESDRRNYQRKAAIIRAIMARDPEAFIRDSEAKGITGLTHRSTGFRLHMPTAELPAENREAKISYKLRPGSVRYKADAGKPVAISTLEALALVNGKQIGKAQLMRGFHGKDIFRKMEVDPEHRGKGVAKELLQRLMDKADADGITTIYTRANPYNDEPLSQEDLMNFYAKFGFKPSDEGSGELPGGGYPVGSGPGSMVRRREPDNRYVLEDMAYGLEKYPELEPRPERIRALRSAGLNDLAQIMEEGHGILSRPERVQRIRSVLTDVPTQLKRMT